MIATVIFEAQLNIKGESIQEIKRKWENMELFSDEAKKCGAEWRKTLAIEDDNFKDITDVWEGEEDD